MILEELINALEIKDTKNFEGNLEIKGIAYHSARVKSDYIYVAIKGYITDGHRYISPSVDNGAIAIIVEDFAEGVDIPQIKVSNSREALSIISDKFYGSPSKDMRVIGVTATNGKTTTTFMLNEIYERANFKTGIIGSVMNKVRERYVPSQLTTPESLDLHELFNLMRIEGVQKVPMEVSSSALELYRVNNVDFDIVSFNNFSREHIDQHGSFEKYWAAKSSLIRNAKEGNYALLNIDDVKIKSLLTETKANVITYSLKDRDAHIYCKNVELIRGRARFKVVINKEFEAFNKKIVKDQFDIELGIPGFHSVENAMVAISIALTDGISKDIIKEGLREFSGVERRFEYIYEKDFLIIDDHFANLKNINVSLETLSHIDHKDLHLIYAIRGNRGVTVNKENAEALVAWKDKLNIKEIIGTKSIGNVSRKDMVSEQEEKVFKDTVKSAGIKLNIYDTLEEAIEKALKNVKDDDIVLLAGCQGMDMGAKIALDYLHGIKPDIKEDELYKPIEKRVVGSI